MLHVAPICYVTETVQVSLNKLLKCIYIHLLLSSLHIRSTFDDVIRNAALDWFLLCPITSHIPKLFYY